MAVNCGKAAKSGGECYGTMCNETQCRELPSNCERQLSKLKKKLEAMNSSNKINNKHRRARIIINTQL